MRISFFFLETKRIGRATVFAFAAAMICTLFLLFGLQAANPAHADTTFTVDRSDDPDLAIAPEAGACTAATANDCSLRGAINAANSTPNSGGPDLIHFNISGSGVKTIQVDGTVDPGTSTDLPIITEAVTINGYSQPEASPNTNTVLAQGTNANLLIELNGGSLTSSNGLIRINTSDVVVKGLVLKCFNTGISIQPGGSRAVIEGNFIGNEPNVCSANTGVGVFGDGANTIGGQEPAARNLISGNLSRGISIADNGGNTIQGNLIGTKANGTEPLGNGQEGVELFSPNTTVGNSTGDDEAGANLIAFNGGDGVKVNGGRNNAYAVGTRILSNSIFSNGDLGIDLDGGDPFDLNPDDGVTKNDKKDRDTGPNTLQNFPRITSTTTTASGGTTTIKGKLNSRPRKTFTLQFFSSQTQTADLSGNEEGKTLLRTLTNVRTNREGVGSFSFQVSTDVSGQFITATATDASGNTSEFSKGCQVPKRKCP